TQHGCVEEYVDSLVIYPDPVAQVDIVTTSDCAPFDIDSSVINAIDFPDAVDSFLWFIDTTGLGNTFDVTLPATASPTFPSIYTIAQENDSIAIRLVTLNVHGCIQDTVDTVFRTFDDPEADFTLDDTIGCHPLIVTATDASTPVSSWNWYIDVADTLGQTPTNFAQIADTLQNPLPFRLNNTGAGIDSVYNIRLIVEVGVTGCKDTASRQVVVLPLPTVDAGPTLEACSNYDTINLNQQSGASPLPGFWSGNGVVQDSLFVPDASLVNVSPGQSLDYIYIDSNGCADTSATFMIVYPLPVINAGADTTVCNQDLPFVAIGVDSLTPAFVPPFGTPPGLPDTAYWTGPLSPYAGPFSATPDSGIIFLSNYPPDSTQPYLLQLTYTDPNRCTVVDTLEVTIIEPIQAFAGFPDSNCLDYGLDTIQGFTPSIGGTWSGPGIVDPSLGVIDTRLAGPGRHELVYSYGSQTCTTYDTIYYIVWPLPIASYTGDLFCEQNPVFFVDESTSDSAAIIDWTWTFGNGDSSFVQDPVYTYPSPGQFNVSLSVVDGNLCEDDTTRLITIHPLPDVLFTNDTAVCEGFELCMNIINPDVNTTYYWDYGDGTLDTTQGTELPCHTYGSGGFYSITLVAVNQFGCVDSSFSFVRVASLPLAEFVPSDSVGCGPLTVNSFNPTPQGAFGSYTYYWDFGGIDTSFDFIPGPFTFPPPLFNDTVYVVEFRVYSAACQAVDVAFANILVSPIPTTIVEADTTSFCSPYTVTFTNNTVGQPETFYINWDDGSDTTGNPSWNTITHEFVNNTLDTVVYDVFVTFQNSCGFTDTIIPITVAPNNTVSDISLLSDSLCPGDSVFFESNAIGYGTVVYDFGDGSPLVSDTSAIVSHLYTQSDTFEVIQYVSDVNNCSSSSDTILVVVHPIPTADFDFSPADYGCDGDTVLVTMINTSLLGEDYSWNLGNGSTSNDFEPSTTYQDSGSYPVELIVTSAFGCLDTALDTFTVYPNPIIYGIDVQPDSGCQPLTVTFQDSTYLGNVRIWNFGDGNTLVDSSAAGSPVSHTYFFPGTYQVDLTVYNFGVCGDTFFDAASVIVFVAPEANFTYMINDIPIPNGGELFTDNLSTDAVAYNWDFGDNFTDTTFEPYHLYESGYGPYQIELEAISIDGCRDTFYASVEFPPFVPNLVFPNAFSPESGLGEAAIFLPHGIGLKEYRFEIYSTFGELIWYTEKLEETSPVEGWDGRDKNGVLLPQDTYVWRAYAKFLDGSTWRGQERDGKLSREGSLILIR
ncbi:MAG: PKD domain-containing protein, partial [Chitinophagales bacterium]